MSCSDSSKSESFLDNIELAFPCLAKWEDMVGDERERFCHSCALNVYNISEMTKSDAEEFLLGRMESRVCVKFYKRTDGTLITDNCPKALRAIRDRGRRLMKIAAGFLAFLGLIPATAGARDHMQGYLVRKDLLNKKTDKNSTSKNTSPVNQTNQNKPRIKYFKNGPQADAEQRIKANIESLEKENKTNTMSGARNFLDLASFYRSNERFEDAIKQYEKAIVILKVLPDGKPLLDNALLNKQAVEKQMNKCNAQSN